MRQFLTLFSAIALLFILVACGPNDDIITDLTVDDPLENINSPLAFSDGLYEIVREELDIPQEISMPISGLPRHMDDVNLPRELSATQQRRALVGRVLFYDTRLSATGETSCATCHQQSAAFGDTKALSDGIRGAVTVRNSPALGGITFPRVRASTDGGSGQVVGPYSPLPESVFVDLQANQEVQGLFWDGRALHTSAQTRETISNPIEMGLDPEEMAAKLNQIPLYQVMARKAHRSRELSVNMIIQDLTDFMLTIPTTNTRFDEFYDMRTRGASETEFAQRFTSSELEGARLFEGNCTSCHGTKGREPFVNFADNGLDLAPTDPGRGAVTGNPFDDGAFKTPFIRNIAVTGPYMHDGRFNTLREVVDHYSDGIQDSPNLHENLRFPDGSVRRMNFSEAEKQALVAFLEMSRDEVMLNAEHLSDPFIR